MFKRFSFIVADLVKCIQTGQRVFALALFFLPFFLLNAHELFSKDSTCQSWFGYIHCADSFKSYYHFAYRVGYYLSALSWLIGGYILHTRLSNARILYVIAISFCIARLINLISPKVEFGWHDEILNFLIVFGVLRIGLFIFKPTNKELKGEDLFYLTESHYNLLSDVEKKMALYKKLFEKEKISALDYVRRIEIQNKRLKKNLQDIDKLIENGG